MENTFVLGSVVMSKSGRDSGNFFAIVKLVDAEYVMISDGEIRKIEKPKKKKIKHLRPNGEILSKIAVKLQKGKQFITRNSGRVRALTRQQNNRR
jgi:ribosomal protein L14E/L6E/L27E